MSHQQQQQGTGGADMLPPPPPMDDSSPSKHRPLTCGSVVSLDRGSSGESAEDMLARLRSEDVLAPLRSEDVLLGGGLRSLTSEDLLTRLRSAEIVKDILLPDSAATAAAAVAANAGEKSNQAPAPGPEGKAGEGGPAGRWPRRANDGGGGRRRSSGGLDALVTAAAAVAAEAMEKSKAPPDQEVKIGELWAKVERNSTGEELGLLNTSFRITSRDWNKDLQRDTSGDSVAMRPSLFLGNTHPSSFKGAAREDSASLLPLKPRTDNSQKYSVPLRSFGMMPPSLPSLKHAKISSSDWIQDFKGESVDLGTMDPSLFAAAHRDAAAEQPAASSPPSSVPSANHLACHLPSSAPKPSSKEPINPLSAAASPLPPAAKKKKKKNRKRLLDETVVVEPNDGDVLSGRGGFTNTHPGNVRFRQKALEFRPWYEESSKEKKQEIADLLVDFVRNEGNRFLGKGKDGQWHEMIGKGPHHKASQALRERIRGGVGNDSGGRPLEPKQDYVPQDPGVGVEVEAVT